MSRYIQMFITGGMVLAAGMALAAPQAPKRPTFSTDVAPIFYANCVRCHRPGDIGPMSLLSYEEARPWAKSIATNVEQGVMPPWHANGDYGEFKNDRSLEEHEIATIVRWVKQGAKAGNPKDMPPAPEFPESGWRLGEPDAIVTLKEVSLAAGGPDRFYDLVGDTVFDEDKMIKAVEILPSNRKVNHHVIVYASDKHANRMSQGWLGAWAAGTDPMVFPEGTGRLLKAGSYVGADMHYHPADTPQKDQTRIGLHFADPGDVERELVNLWIVNQSFEIPAGNSNYEARATFTFPQDSVIYNYLPHMHYRGKDFTYVAEYPDGTDETLMKVDDYDFNWQTVYELAEPKPIPAGTTVTAIAHWDNSANNPANPDPTKNVRFGNESYDEMLIGFIDYAVVEGARPLTVEEQLDQRATELHAADPGHVYRVKLGDAVGDDEHSPGVLHLPQTGEGAIDVGTQGRLFSGRVTEITWTGDSFDAKLLVEGFGGGTLKGQLAEGPYGLTATMHVFGQDIAVWGDIIE